VFVQDGGDGIIDIADAFGRRKTARGLYAAVGGGIPVGGVTPDEDAVSDPLQPGVDPDDGYCLHRY
jgi:hypothetical protein